jgi:hypothetical protein
VPDFSDPAFAYAALIGEIDHVTKQELIEIGEFAQTIVLTRTKLGLDADGKPFVPYSDAYAKERAERGLSRTPDLAVKGHMLGAMISKPVSDDEVQVTFANPLEALKAQVHNDGSGGNSSVALVKPHSRVAYISIKTGQRVSRAEAKKDAKRKNKRTKTRTESVGQHGRHMNTPQREFLDVRIPREVQAMAEAISEKLLTRVEKKLK